MSYAIPLPPEVEEFLHTYGSEQMGRPLPRRWRRRGARTTGDPYAKAGRWCLGEPVMYTEGRVLSGGIADWDWAAHAWLTADDGGVIDLALDEEISEATGYFGVRIPTLVVVRIARGQEVPRPLLPELIRSGWTPT